jgi:exodeoxyribonuclease VII small subunit
MSKNDLTFAAAYAELQTLTKEFEQGNLDLELAIPKYKRASELAQFLKQRLTELESQIQEINVTVDKPSPVETDDAVTASSDDIPF